MKEILLQSNSKTIKNLCLTNKVFKEFCNDKVFWHDKFEIDQLPQLVIVKTHQHKGHKLQIPMTMKQLPKNINKWIATYDKMLNCRHIAIKFVNNIIETKTFTNFSTVVDVHMALWLPKSMNDYVMNDEQLEILLYFEYTDYKFYIELIKSEEESSDEESFRKPSSLKIELSKDEFIMYLTLLFYYEGDDEEFMLEDQEGRYLHMKDLYQSKRIKKYFSNW